MKCLKDTNKNCHSKVITPEWDELPACIRGLCVGDIPRKGRTLIKNPTKSQLQSIADLFQRPVAIPVDMKKEAEMYERFHHKSPGNIVKVSHPQIPKSLVALGKLESVIYRKISDGQSYIHDLDHGILAADRKGKLYIIGDKAKITERGIVG
ncbi:MAG: hypothetical protein OIN66_02405 [Candidatus Methanoperedens sp.]|nr:hypothetical protein [Candidatus Methanoperedens sp.]